MKTVILAAGFGSRLWPLSTSERPKQFQTLIGDQSLLQHTYGFLSEIIQTEELYVLTLKGLEDMVFEQLPGINPDNVITVPERRNTLPHTLYALKMMNVADDESVLFCPVDHYIADGAKFSENIAKALSQATVATASTHLLCVEADTIESGLGYVQVDGESQVLQFIEKPDAQTIAELKNMNNVYVNTLRFITSVSAMRSALSRVDEDFAPPAAELLAASSEDLDSRFLAMQLIDISHGLFENDVAGLRAIPIKNDFIDIGRFSTLYQINKKDQRGNVIMGTVFIDDVSSGNFIVNQTSAPLAVVNTQNSVVIQTPNGSFTSPIKSAEAIGEIYKTRIKNATR